MTASIARRALLGSALALPAIRSARAATPIRIGFIPVIGCAPLFVVNGSGWAKEADLQLQLTQFESGPNAIQAVASGTLDAYVAGFAPVAVVRSRGVDLRIVAATAVEEFAVVARGGLAQAFAKAPNAKQALAAFTASEGRRPKLATQPAGSVPNTLLQYWLREQAKADPATYEIVAMGIDATQQALLARAVDGAIVREPALTILRDRDTTMAIAATGNDLFPNQPGGVLALTGAFIQREPRAATELVRLFARATRLLNETRDAAVPAIAAALGKGIVPDDVIRRALHSPASKFAVDPRTIMGPMRALLEYQVTLGATTEAPPPEGLFDDSLYLRAIKG